MSRSPFRGTVSFPGRASSPRGAAALSPLRSRPPACPPSTHLAHEPSPSPLTTSLASATSSGTAVSQGWPQGSPSSGSSQSSARRDRLNGTCPREATPFNRTFCSGRNVLSPCHHVGLLRCHTPGARWLHTAGGHWSGRHSVGGIPGPRGMGRCWTHHAQRGPSDAPGSRGLGRKTWMQRCAPGPQPWPPAVRRLGRGQEQAPAQPPRAPAPGTEGRSPTCERLSLAGPHGGSANAELWDPGHECEFSQPAFLYF